MNVIVAVNKFSTDSDAEIELVKKKALEAGADSAILCDHWAKGGAGAADLAAAVAAACEKNRKEGSNFKFLYPLEVSVKDKIESVCKNIYGADGVQYSELAEKKIAMYTKNGFDNLPVCMAKTHLSFR